MLSQADSVELYIDRMCAAEPERQAKAAAASGQHDASSKSDEFYLELDSTIEKWRTAADKSEEAATAAAAVIATARSLARSLARSFLRANSCAHHALSPAPAHTPPRSELRSTLLGVCRAVHARSLVSSFERNTCQQHVPRRPTHRPDRRNARDRLSLRRGSSSTATPRSQVARHLQLERALPGKGPRQRNACCSCHAPARAFSVVCSLAKKYTTALHRVLRQPFKWRSGPLRAR